jgi:hypothetical protein
MVILWDFMVKQISGLIILGLLEREQAMQRYAHNLTNNLTNSYGRIVYE